MGRYKLTLWVALAALAVAACSGDSVWGASVDGPIIVAPAVGDSGDDARIAGILEVTGDCVELRSSEDTFGVAWPAGTRWDDASAAVVLADGRELRHGETVVAAGAYRANGIDPTVTEASQRCGFDTIAVLNPTVADIQASQP